jgi:AcrR family transcriptional regulator
MSSKIQDERYRITEEAICDAFLLLLKEKELDRITVSDVVKRAGIVRSTFYNHYEDIPALVTAIEDQTIEDLFALMETFHPKNDREVCRSFFMAVCSYTKTNPFMANLLQNPRSNAFFEKNLTMLHRYVRQTVQSTTPSRHSKEEYSYMIACAIGSTLGVLHKWALGNFQTPVETVAELLTQAFVNGMLPFMS